MDDAVRWFAVVLAILLSLAQACLWVYLSNTQTNHSGASIISVLGMGVLFVVALAINPALQRASRYIRLGPLRRGELVAIYAAMFVTTGVSTFGLVDQFVPLITTPYNPAWNTAQRGWREEVNPNLNPHLFIQDAAVISEYRRGIGTQPTESASWHVWIGYYAGVITDIPWSHWRTPLIAWLVFAAAWYALFYSISAVVLPFWSYREKLIFPLARLPEALLPDARSPGVIPAIYRSPIFWSAFAFSFSILGYNALVDARWISGLRRIPLGAASWQAVEYFQGSFMAGTDYWFAFIIFFTTIGLAFLLPTEMSFSAWFYFVLSRFAMVNLKFLGLTGNPIDFRGDIRWKSDPFCSQGAGALMTFAAISLARCVHEFHRLSSGKPWRQRVRIGAPVIAMTLSAAALVAWFTWCGLPWYWSAALIVISTLLTVGLMRLVAEAGIYWFQVHGGFFHLFRMLSLGRLLAPALLGPILPLYGVLFSDAKCFLAPAIASAADLRRSTGGSKWRIHLTVIASLAVAVVGSTLFVVVLGYTRGGDNMATWFYATNPQKAIDAAQTLATQTPRFEPANVAGFVGGGVWVAVSMYLRRTLFWFPHPVGYMALISPLMEQLWLSFLIAWVAKVIVVRYGSKDVYMRARAAAIGLIMGELVAVAFWAIASMATDGAFRNISINRYGG